MLAYEAPILFIEILNEDNKTKFRVTDEAQDFFEALADKKVN